MNEWMKNWKNFSMFQKNIRTNILYFPSIKLAKELKLIIATVNIYRVIYVQIT